MIDHPWFRHYDAGVPRTLGACPARTLLDDLEVALAAHPAVLEAGVRGFPDLAPYKVLRRLLAEDEELVS